LRAPVSSGQTGYETPAGIYSVIQKEEEPYSNLYDDASMPFMQRITWSGIALHAGQLPGYPASHGCVRMPYEFAQRLFDMTKIGMRVIVARNDVRPVEIDHPVLFKPKLVRADLALNALTAHRDAARAEARTASPETAPLEADVSSPANPAEPDAEAQLAAAKGEAPLKADAAARARDEARAAAAEKVSAVEDSREAARMMSPVSIFVSRKTQRLYVRQSFQPVLESPITIHDADHPIGTHIYTVLDYANDGADLRWSAVSMDSRQLGQSGRHTAEPMAPVLGPAREALDRIEIPQDIVDRISELISPGSSLIISDEGMSTETGEDTDFVILMSGEPQGAIKMRRHEPDLYGHYDRQYDRSYGRSPAYAPSFDSGDSFVPW
jgi:lipoprotein-anchoring transpeptidase ErfK/SrfK